MLLLCYFCRFIHIAPHCFKVYLWYHNNSRASWLRVKGGFNLGLKMLYRLSIVKKPDYCFLGHLLVCVLVRAFNKSKDRVNHLICLFHVVCLCVSPVGCFSFERRRCSASGAHQGALFFTAFTPINNGSLITNRLFAAFRM